MNKRARLTLVIGAAALVCVGGLLAALAGLPDRPFRQAGRVSAATPDGGIAMIVNGIPISQGKLQRSLQTKQLMYEESIRLIREADFLTEQQKEEQIASIAAPGEEEAENQLIREAVLLSIAQQRGIAVTDEEVRSQVDGTNATIDAMAAEGEEAARYVRGSLEAYAEGLGMSYAEYTEEIVVPAIREQLMRTKLRAQVLAKAAQNPSAQGMNSEADPWEAFVEEAISNAEIVYPGR